MTTLPTPLFYILCILAMPTVCGILAVLAVGYMMVRFEHEQRQREKRANEEAITRVEMYLKQISLQYPHSGRAQRNHIAQRRDCGSLRTLRSI